MSRPLVNRAQIALLALLLAMLTACPKQQASGTNSAPDNPYGNLKSAPPTETSVSPTSAPDRQPGEAVSQGKTPPGTQPPSRTPEVKLIPALPANYVLLQPGEEGPVTLGGPLPTHPDGWYALGQSYRTKLDHRRAARAFAQAAALNPSAANWRALADEYVALGQYAAATRAYGQAATRYRQQGDSMTARALDYLAAPYRQTAQWLLIAPKSGATQVTLAKFEPPRGLMLGVHVAGNGVQGAWGKPGRLTDSYRPFAVAFRYWKLSKSQEGALIFPGRFAGAVRDSGQAMHLALEPGMPLNEITDEIIQAFGREAKAANLPIFVRFASEMNDPKNDWSADPALYRRTFARVARILHATAPNVAMVWMPMPGDLKRIAEYYPGPDAVDWAGLSLYSVPFENGDSGKPRLNAHPLDTIDGFYQQYAPRHPIQLSEYAASNHSGASPGRDFSAFAAQQMREVYWGAWQRYPRLKNINWLDIDMHTDPLVRTGKQERRNDYRLFTIPAKWDAFKRLRKEGAFFQSFKQAQCQRCAVDAALPWPARLTPQQARRGVTGQLWLQTARPAARVKLLLNNKEIPVEAALPYQFNLPPLAPGKHLLTLRVLDEQGKVLLEDNKLFLAGG